MENIIVACVSLGLAIRYIAWMPDNGWLMELVDGSTVIGADEWHIIQNARIKKWAMVLTKETP